MSDQSGRERSVTIRRKAPPAWPEELERLFDRAARAFGSRSWRPFWRRRPWMWRPEEWLPDADVFEREGQVVVRVDLPGVRREEIEVAMEGDMLVIRGRREEEKEVKEEGYYFCERASGEFQRSIGLPEGANTEAIEATYQDGVLEVTVPRPAPPETKKITITVK
jgi:HSP20 family protein